MTLPRESKLVAQSTPVGAYMRECVRQERSELASKYLREGAPPHLLTAMSRAPSHAFGQSLCFTRTSPLSPPLSLVVGLKWDLFWRNHPLPPAGQTLLKFCSLGKTVGGKLMMKKSTLYDHTNNEHLLESRLHSCCSLKWMSRR